MTMVKPISPKEVTLKIHDFIIEAVNKLIQEKWDGKEAVILQDEIMDIVSSNDEDDIRPSRDEIYDRNWLDFEDIYRKAGWNVLYDKPAYCENYKAYFKFTKKSKRND